MIHIFIRPIFILCGLGEVGLIDLRETYVVRNVYFDAIPFILVGFSIHMRKNQYLQSVDSGKKISSQHYLKVAVFWGLISIIESFAVSAIVPSMNCVLYVGTIISEVALFEFCIVHPTVNGILGKMIAKYGQGCSMITYFIHPIVGGAVERLNVTETVFPAVVIAVTIIFSALICECWNLVKTRILEIGQKKQ